MSLRLGSMISPLKRHATTIKREFFKNNMSVLFSMNGQVHGNYTSEFITRSLKLPLLKDYLLIHVDCTNVRTEFRNELFMASRDRLKGGDESRRLRSKLSSLLSEGRLKDIHKTRKASITVESDDAEDLVRKMSRNLPIRNELAELLGQTFTINDKREGKSNEKSRENKKNTDKQDKLSFSPRRYPSFFKVDLNTRNGEEIPMVGLPLGGKKTIRFSTDVEDHYFDRVKDPGELQIGLLDLSSNDVEGGDQPGEPKELDTILNVVRSSPRDGTISIQMKPTKELHVGNTAKIHVSLSSPEKVLEQVFLVKIVEPSKKVTEQKKGDQPDMRLGLPQLVMVYKDESRGKVTWETLEKIGIQMDRDVVVYPMEDEDLLSAIYINMDSKVLLSHRARLTKEEAISVAEKRYISAVYFHTLFLYTITRNLNYGIVKQHSESDENDQTIDVNSYISDLFRTFYAQFLLTFDTQELLAALEA